MLVFDITDQDSFYHLYQWIDQYNYYCEFPVKNIVIVGNKHDRASERRVSELEIRQFAESMGCVYVPCSVLADEGMDTLTSTIIEKSIELESHLDGTLDKKENTITLTGNKEDISNINPIKLNVKRKEKSCCSD